jgi:DNA-binding MarR family transcriptional regulator
MIAWPPCIIIACDLIEHDYYAFPFKEAPMDDTLKLDKFLCFAVYAAGHAFSRVYKPLLDAIGLTYPQYLVMVVLWQEDRQTVGQIGEKLHLESSTLTPLLKRLETAGLVERQRNAADQRQVHIALTGKGRALSAQARQIPSCVLSAAGGDAQALHHLTQELTQLRTTLEQGQLPASPATDAGG